MIKDKKVIGVCITKIQENDRVVYLDRLYHYANAHGYKLIIFNSYADYGTQNSFHDDDCVIYDLIDFHIVDILAVHSKSFPDSTIPAILFLNCIIPSKIPCFRRILCMPGLHRWFQPGI